MSQAHQPEENLGGRGGIARGERGVGWLLFHYALPLSSALLRVGLIERRDGLFGLEQPAMGPVILLTVALNVAAQLGDLVESLIKRGAGVKTLAPFFPAMAACSTDRRSAFCRPYYGLYGLARDAVTLSRSFHKCRSKRVK